MTPYNEAQLLHGQNFPRIMAAELQTTEPGVMWFRNATYRPNWIRYLFYGNEEEDSKEQLLNGARTNAGMLRGMVGNINKKNERKKKEKIVKTSKIFQIFPHSLEGFKGNRLFLEEWSIMNIGNLQIIFIRNRVNISNIFTS